MKKLEDSFSEVVAVQSKSFMMSYSALQHTILVAIQTRDNKLMSESLNRMVAVIVNEIGLVNITASEMICYPSKDQCIEYVDQKLRIAKSMTSLFLEPLVETNVLNEFMNQIESLGDTMKSQITESFVAMGDSKLN